MPFLLAEILNFQGSTHRIGVGSFSYKLIREPFDISEQVSQLGNLPPATERLVKLIQDFSEN